LNPTIQLNVRVRKSTRNHLELVSLIYDISWRDILELAPLLFFISAEQSLAARKKSLDNAEQEIEDAVSSASVSMPHLSGAFRPGYDYERIKKERDSIKNRDIFGADFDDEDELPFVNFLEAQIKGLEEQTKGLSIDIWSDGFYQAPNYTFPLEWVQKLTGLSYDEKTEVDILRLIHSGEIDLREVLSNKSKLKPDAFRAWLNEENQKVSAKNKSLIPDEIINLLWV
jgi:hypothetical protein